MPHPNRTRTSPPPSSSLATEPVSVLPERARPTLLRSPRAPHRYWRESHPRPAQSPDNLLLPRAFQNRSAVAPQIPDAYANPQSPAAPPSPGNPVRSTQRDALSATDHASLPVPHPPPRSCRLSPALRHLRSRLFRASAAHAVAPALHSSSQVAKCDAAAPRDYASVLPLSWWMPSPTCLPSELSRPLSSQTQRLRQTPRPRASSRRSPDRSSARVQSSVPYQP